MDKQIILTLCCVLCFVFFSGCIFSNDNEDNEYNIVFVSSYSRKSYDKDSNDIYEYMKVLVTDNKGNPLLKKRVDWQVLEGDAVLQDNSTITESKDYSTIKIGESSNFLTWHSSPEASIKVIVFGSNASTIFTIKIKLM